MFEYQALMFAYFRAPVSWTELARRTVADTFRDGCPALAAQLAFYFLLALSVVFVTTAFAQKGNTAKAKSGSAYTEVYSKYTNACKDVDAETVERHVVSVSGIY